MKKLILTICLAIALAGVVRTQDYKSAIGGKLGYGLVASYKTFFNEKNAVELFGGLSWRGLVAGGFYQIHKDIPSVDNLRWFVGGGASFSTWTYLATSNYIELTGHFNIGLEYTFSDLPLNVAVDYAPGIVIVDTYNFAGAYNRFRGGYGTLTARYILKKDKS